MKYLEVLIGTPMSGGGGGNMTKTVYDPTGREEDVFAKQDQNETDIDNLENTKLDSVQSGSAGVSIDMTDPLNPSIIVAPSTSAGVTGTAWFTGDEETTTEGTFYLTSTSGKGSVPIASGPTPLTLGDDDKQYFDKDLLSAVYPIAFNLPKGSITGFLNVQSNSNHSEFEFCVELYACDDQGVVVDSGIAAAPVGNLGVKVVAELCSGKKVHLETNKPDIVAVSGFIDEQYSVVAGNRFRYHVSAHKVGTAGGNKTVTVFYGSDASSLFVTPLIITTNSVVNLSSAIGGDQTTVNDNFEAAINTNATDIGLAEGRLDTVEANKIEANNYGTATVGGTAKFRLDGTILHIKTDGTDA